MVWFRVDDKFHSHPKRHRCSLAAIGLWSVAGSWCGEQDKNKGVVPDYMLPAFGASPKLAGELVAAGLWDVIEGGWVFHDWTELNPDEEQVAAKRAADKERKRRWREAQEAKRSQRDATVTDGVTGASVTDLSAPRRSYPTRPDPTRPAVSTERGNGTEPFDPADATKPPSNYDNDRCDQHQGIVDPPPCNGCRRARERNEKTSARAAELAALRRQREANACKACDGVHVVDEQGHPTRRKCDHRSVVAS